MEGETYYDVLGLDHRTCGFADIKKAYRTQARLHHPDRVAPENKEESTIIFRRLTEAYEVLSDGPKKLRYDSTMGLYRKRPSDVAQEAGNYFNKNASPKVKSSDKKLGNFIANAFGKNKTQERRPSDVAKKRPSDVAMEAGNYFNKNTVGKKISPAVKTGEKKQSIFSKKKPPGDADVETGNYFRKNAAGRNQTADTNATGKRRCPMPTCKIKEWKMPKCTIKQCASGALTCKCSCDDDMDSITVFTFVTVACGAVFFFAVLVYLIVALSMRDTPQPDSP